MRSTTNIAATAALAYMWPRVRRRATFTSSWKGHLHIQLEDFQKLLGMVWGPSVGLRMALQKFDSTQIYEKTI